MFSNIFTILMNELDDKKLEKISEIAQNSINEVQKIIKEQEQEQEQTKIKTVSCEDLPEYRMLVLEGDFINKYNFRLYLNTKLFRELEKENKIKYVRKQKQIMNLLEQYLVLLGMKINYEVYDFEYYKNSSVLQKVKAYLGYLLSEYDLPLELLSPEFRIEYKTSKETNEQELNNVLG